MTKKHAFHYNTGDSILIDIHGSKPDQADKFLSKFRGPYVFIRCDSPNVTVKCPNSSKTETVHINRTKLYYKRNSNNHSHSMTTCRPEEAQVTQPADKRSQTDSTAAAPANGRSRRRSSSSSAASVEYQ